MKVQIRRHVFETNSSTNHTLCMTKAHEFADTLLKLMKKDDEEHTVISVPDMTAIDFEFYKDLRYKSIINISDLNFIERLNIVVISALSCYETSEFLGTFVILNEVLADFGIVLDIDFNKLYELSTGEYWHEGIYDTIQSLCSKEDIKHFLFSNDCHYTEWCDECSEEPCEEIEKIEDRFMSMDEDQRIILRERN